MQDVDLRHSRAGDSSRRNRPRRRQFGVALGVLLLLSAGGTQRAVAGSSGTAFTFTTTYLGAEARTGYIATETALSPANATHLTLKVTHGSGGSVTAQPAEANGMMYWGSWDGYERATGIGSPGTVWATNLGTTTSPGCGGATAGIASSATVASVTVNGAPTSLVFVGGGNAVFYALNALTGAIVWQTRLGPSPATFIWSSPAFYQGGVYIGVASFGDCPLVQGQLVQLDAATGTIQHVFDVVPNGCTGGAVWSSPTVDTASGLLYLTTGNPGACSTGEPYTEAIVALRASDLAYAGSWQVPPAQRGPDGDFGATATLFTATVRRGDVGVVMAMVGAVNKNGIYYAFDRRHLWSGPVWTRRVSIGGDCPQCGGAAIAPSAWDGTWLYVAAGTTSIQRKSCAGSVRALDPGNGAPRWERCLGDGQVLGAVMATPGLLFVNEGPYLVVLTTASGYTLFDYREPQFKAFLGASAIAIGVVYDGNTDGTLYSFGL